MFIIAVIFILVTVIMISITARIAYITNNDPMRKKILAKHKTKHGELSYDVYSKVYTRQFVIALSLVSVWLVLNLVSDVVEGMQGRNSILSLTIGGVGLVVGFVGLYLVSSTLKRE